MSAAMFTRDEEAFISERARMIADARARTNQKVQRRAVIREAHRRAAILSPLPKVRLDRLQELDDFIEPVNDDTARARRLRSIASCAADLIDEFVELLSVHVSSSRVEPAVAPAVLTPTLGDSADPSSPLGGGSASTSSVRPVDPESNRAEA